jgi:hypothetical protein
MATRKLQFSGQSALTGYAILRQLDDQFWNNTHSALESFTTANYAEYPVLIPEIETSGMYSGSVPAALPIGQYHVTYKHKAGGTYAQSDEVIFQELIGWDGAEIVDDLVIGNSIADICNMALSHLGIAEEIANLETDTGEEAIACRQFYETARDVTLKAFTWPFATRIVALGLIEEDPTPDWYYSYRYPSSALYLWKMASDTETLDPQVKIPYKVIGDDSGRIILTNLEDASVEYVSRVENPILYTPDFVEAMSYRLAAYIAPRLTAGDPFKLGEKALQMYVGTVREAKAQNANEEVRDSDSYESSFLRERND